MTVRRNRRKAVEETPTATLADLLKAKFGWKPSQRPFRTTANRQCGACKAVKSGSEFDCPVTPGRPDLNKCRECTTSI